MSAELAQALERKKGDRSLRALARDLKVAVGTAEAWLNGWRSPDLRHVPVLAAYLDVPIGTIVEWEIRSSTGAKGRYIRSDTALLAA